MKRVSLRNPRVLLLLLYGVFVFLSILVAVAVQARLVGQILRVGDPGFDLWEAAEGSGFRVTRVAPGSSTSRVLQVGDRVLRVGDLDLARRPAARWFHRLGNVWRYRGHPVGPGDEVPVVFQRQGRGRLVRGQVLFEAGSILTKQFEPGSPSLAVFLFAWLLPSRLTMLGFFLIGVVILMRRPASSGARICYLLVTSAALSFSYAFGSPSLYPQPLRWLAEHAHAVEAWIPAFVLQFVLVVPDNRVFGRRFRAWMAVPFYLPAAAIAGVALLSSVRPEARPAWMWVATHFAWYYWVPFWSLVIARIVRNALSASTASGRRQARTILLAIVPWFAIQLVMVSFGSVPPPPLYVVWSLVALLLPLSLAYAILYQGMLDLGMVVRRGLVYGAVTAVGGAGYYLLILVMGRLLLSLTRETGTMATMAATLALAALLRPVAVRTRRWVDQAFYRDRLEAIRRLRQMSQEILSLLDRDTIRERLTIELPAIFHARGATLYLLDAEEGAFRPARLCSNAPALRPDESHLLSLQERSGRAVTSYDLAPDASAATLSDSDREVAERLGVALWVPLLLRGRLVGTLALGWKESEEVYTEEEIDLLALIASEAAVAIENATLSAQREQQARLQQEVAIGRSIQMSLLAPPEQRVGRFEIRSRSEPASEVGGDFYNFFEIGHGAGERWGIVLGDVAGKGVPAALYMAVTTTLIRGQAQLLPSPAETLAAANAELYPMMRATAGHPTQSGGWGPRLFSTAIYGVLDPHDGEMRLANAGQTPPIYWPADGLPRYLRFGGIPLGALPTSQYEETAVRLRPGDRLLLCSDGFIEELGADGRVVGYDGFLRRLEDLAGLSGPQLLNALFDGRDPNPSADESMADDRTLVLIEGTR